MDILSKLGQEEDIKKPIAGAKKSFSFINFIKNVSGGKITSDHQASLFLLILAFFLILLSFLLYFILSPHKSANLPAGSKVINAPNQPPRLEHPIP